MSDASYSPKGYRFPKLVIGHAVYLYHHLTISYREEQELLFKRGIDVSHETVRAWCVKFEPDLAEALRQHKPRRGRIWHLDEMRIVIGNVMHWLWRAINEHGEMLDVLLQRHRDGGAAKRLFRRLIGDHELPDRIVTNRLRVLRRSARFWSWVEASTLRSRLQNVKANSSSRVTIPPVSRSSNSEVSGPR